MSLPLPPKRPLPMPPLPAAPVALPDVEYVLAAHTPYDPDVDEHHFSHVSKVDRDKALVRIGNNRAFLSRAECYTLIGQLERVARRL